MNVVCDKTGRKNYALLRGFLMANTNSLMGLPVLRLLLLGGHAEIAGAL